MSILKTIGNRLFEWIPILIIGIILGTSIAKGCYKPSVTTTVDTLVIDTSKIITKAPIVVRNITTYVVDSIHDCWNAMPEQVLDNGDTVSCDSVNSCKGLYRGLRLKYKPVVIHDTIVVPFEKTVIVPPPSLLNYADSLALRFPFGYSAHAGVFAGYGCNPRGFISGEAHLDRSQLTIEAGAAVHFKPEWYVGLAYSYQLVRGGR